MVEKLLGVTSGIICIPVCVCLEWERCNWSSVASEFYHMRERLVN
jgi:hypothetical protein